MRRQHLYVIKCVCDHFGLTKTQLMDSENKTRDIAIPRQIAVHLIKKNCLFTNDDISNIFGMKTASWAFSSDQSITALMQTSRYIADAVKAIEAKLPYTGISGNF